MKVLSINTTGEGTQLALCCDGKEFFVDAGFSKHSETLFPLIEGLMEKANTTIDGTDFFGVVIGPGSFTGIRIGVAVAKTFAYVKNAKCVALNSLEVLAYNIFDRKKQTQKPVCAIINAGADMVYYQMFERQNDTLKPLCSPKVSLLKHFTGFIHSVYNDDVEFVYYDNNEKSKSMVDFLAKSENFTPKSLNACVLNNIKNGNICSLYDVAPIYLRSSQAENFVFDKLDTKIVRATKNDVAAICELETQDDPEDLPWSKVSVEQSFDNPSFICWLLKSKGNVLGYVSAINLTEEFEVLRIVVHKNARLQGVGMALLDFVMNYAKQNGAQSLLLDVNDHNYPAMSLYEKMGFSKVGERKQYYSKTENALLLKKVL